MTSHSRVTTIERLVTRALLIVFALATAALLSLCVLLVIFIDEIEALFLSVPLSELMFAASVGAVGTFSLSLGAQGLNWAKKTLVQRSTGETVPWLHALLIPQRYRDRVLGSMAADFEFEHREAWSQGRHWDAHILAFRFRLDVIRAALLLFGNYFLDKLRPRYNISK